MLSAARLLCHPALQRGIPLRRALPSPLGRGFRAEARNDTGWRAAARGRYMALVALTLLIAQTASACPVCFGEPDDPMVKGVNSGIWVLLGVVGAVQIGFVAMFWSFWKRGRDQRRFRESLKVIEGGPHA